MLSGNISGKIIESYDVGGYVGFDKYEGNMEMMELCISS